MAKLKKRRALSTAGRMQELFPDMVEFLNTQFYSNECDPETGKPFVSVKERLGIAKFFAETSKVKAQVEQSLGLSKHSEKAEGDQLTMICGGDVTVFKGLPASERQALVLKMLKGETPEPIKVEAEVADAV